MGVREPEPEGVGEAEMVGSLRFDDLVGVVVVEVVRVVN